MDLRIATPILQAYIKQSYDVTPMEVHIKSLPVSTGGDFFRVKATFCEICDDPSLGTYDDNLILQVVEAEDRHAVIKHDVDANHANVVEIAKVMDANIKDYELCGAPAEVVLAAKALAQAMKNWSNLQGSAS